MNDGRTEPEREALPLEDVGRLVELLAESGIGEIRVRQGELEITVKARSEAAAGTPSAPQTEPQATPRIEVTPVPEAEPSVEYPAERNGGLHVVRSPVVGTIGLRRRGENPMLRSATTWGRGSRCASSRP